MLTGLGLICNAVFTAWLALKCLSKLEEKGANLFAQAFYLVMLAIFAGCAVGSLLIAGLVIIWP